MQEEINQSKFLKYLIVFSILIVLAGLLANSTGLADTGDYAGVAKGLTGNFVTKMRSSHSWVYGLILSVPLKMFYSEIFMKILNVVWLVLTGLYLYRTRKDKRIFLIYALSPIVWFMSPWVSPILPASLMLLVAYDFMKKYEIEKRVWHLIAAGALIGLASIVWDTMMFIAVIFIICFFYKKTVKELLTFLAAFAVLFSIRFIIDYYLFSFPLFSLFRVFGGNLSAALHIGNYQNLSYSILDYIMLFVVVSPMFVILYYRLVKEDFATKKTEIFLIGLSMLLIIMNPQIRYLLGIAPLAIVILGKKIKSDREMIISAVISLVFILLIIYPYYGATYESKLKNDIAEIAKDFPEQTFLAGSSENSDLYMNLGMAYWGSNIKEILSWQDFDLWRKNETNFQHYRIESNAKVNEIRKLWIEVGLSRTDNRTFEDVKYLINDKNTTELKNFKLIKSYSALSVFENVNN